MGPVFFPGWKWICFTGTEHTFLQGIFKKHRMRPGSTDNGNERFFRAIPVCYLIPGLSDVSIEVCHEKIPEFFNTGILIPMTEPAAVHG